MSCTCCNGLAEPVAAHCQCSACQGNLGHSPSMQSSGCFHHQSSALSCLSHRQQQHCYPECSSSYHHIPIASPLHSSHTPPNSTHWHSTHHTHSFNDPYHTPQQHHRQYSLKHTQPFYSSQTYSQPIHSRRELVLDPQISNAQCETPLNRHPHPHTVAPNILTPTSRYSIHHLPQSPGPCTPTKSVVKNPVAMLEFSPDTENVPSRNTVRQFQLGYEDSENGVVNLTNSTDKLRKVKQRRLVSSDMPKEEANAVPTGYQFDCSIFTTQSDNEKSEEDEDKCIKEDKVQSSPSICLVHWCFRIHANNYVFLFGFKEQDLSGKRWRSGPVKECLSPRVLVTKSGTVYQLNGPMDRQGMDMTEDGCRPLTPKTISLFNNGFPKSWNKILSCDKYERSICEGQQLKHVTPTTRQLEHVTPTTRQLEHVTPTTRQLKHVMLEHVTPTTRQLEHVTPTTRQLEHVTPTTRQLEHVTPTTRQLKHVTPTTRQLEHVTPTTRQLEHVAPSSMPQLQVKDKKPKIKTEQAPWNTPEQDTDLSSSGFLSTLKYSKYGRAIKPSMISLSPYIQTGCSRYSYDVYGNFRGLKSDVIDLTLSDSEEATSICTKKRGVSVSQKAIKMDRIKKESEVAKIESASYEEAPSVLQTRTGGAKGKTRRRKITSDSESCCKSLSYNPSPIRTRLQRWNRMSSSEPDDKTTTKQATLVVGSEQMHSSNMSEGLDNVPDQIPDTTGVNKKTKASKTQPKRRRPGVLVLSAKKSVKRKVTKEIVDCKFENDSKKAFETESRNLGNKIKINSETELSSKEGSRNRTAESISQKDSPHYVIQTRNALKKSRDMRGKGKLRRAMINSDTELSDEEVSSNWTAEDIAILKSVVRNIHVLTPNFWTAVASQLATGHSARECNAKYTEVYSKPSSQNQAKPRKTKKVVVKEKQTNMKWVVTGKAGTLKRKRQLRTAMDHMEKGYSDDILESTPFKKRVKTVYKLPEWSNSDGGESGGDNEDGDEPSSPETTQKHLGAPETRTPKLSDVITTPDLNGGRTRDVADTLVYRMQKTKPSVRAQPKSKVSLPKRPKPRSTKPLLSEQKLRNIRTGEMTTLRMFEDTDDEESSDENLYPFSDLDESYQEILARIH